MKSIFATVLLTAKQNYSIFSLMLTAFLVAFFGANDFLTATSTYGQLNLNEPLKFVIEEKYNKVNREILPDLKYNGLIINLKERKEIGISRSDYDQYMVGDTITIFKSKSDDVYMTQYEVDNQIFIMLLGKPVSFVLIPTFITFIIGLLILFILIKKFKRNTMSLMNH